MDWLFVAGRRWLAAEGDPFRDGLGGTEQAILHLSAALAARGAQVAVAGACAGARRFGGVAFLPPGIMPHAAVTVAINDALLLPAGPGRKVVWFHNEVGFWRECRKRRLGALARHRPAAVFIGREQARHAARALPFRARHVIPYGLPPRVMAAAAAEAVPEPHAIFTSQAYRGLREIIALWRDQVAPACPGARLSAFIGADDVAAYQALAADVTSIRIAPRVSNDQVLALLRTARLLLAPGHVSETFCLAAAEAIAMGVPVVTRGIGSLKERVADGQTGFICADWPEMAARTRQLLSDIPCWAKLHDNGIASRAGHGWDRVAARWDEVFGG